MARKQQEPTRQTDRTLTPAERLAKSRQEQAAMAAFAAKLTAVPKRRQ